MLGDFNVDVSAVNPLDGRNTFSEEFSALHFIPFVTVPTRFVDDTATPLQCLITFGLIHYTLTS